MRQGATRRDTSSETCFYDACARDICFSSKALETCLEISNVVHASWARDPLGSVLWGYFMSNTFFGLLAEFGEATIPLDKIAPKYFGLSYEEARRRAPAKLLPCKVFRLGGQKSPWLVSAVDLAELIDRQRQKAG
jgi:hypothetical protein